MEAQYLPRRAQVGDRVEVCWEEEGGAWFAGMVGAHKPQTGFPYRLDYDDGDTEWVLFTSSSVLEAVWSENDEPEASTQRQYRVLDGAPSNGSRPVPTVSPVASPEQAAAKRKRGRPPGFGKKPVAAGGAAGMAYPRADGGGGAAAAGQQPEQHLRVGSPPKKARKQHPAAAVAGGKAAAPSLLSQLTATAPGSAWGSFGSLAPSAVPSGAGTAALANGASPLDVSSRGQGGAAPLAGSFPLAAAPPLCTPGGAGLRDPRRGPGSTATGVSSVEAAMQQEQQQQEQQQVARPAAVAPAAVTVIGFQFSAELASVSAAADDSTAGLRSAGSSRGTTPHAPRRSSSHGWDLHNSAGASAPGAAAGLMAQQGAHPTPAGAGAAAGLPSEEEIEREVACRNFERMLQGLTRTKEAIGRATGLALQAAKCNAAPGLMRLVLARMAAEDSIQQRVNLLYLVDSILQTSVREREGRTDCGPQSAAGQAYPRVVGAALSQLIEAVARDVQATEKLEKVLLIWQRKAIISEKLLEPALLLARTKSAQHASAWGDVDVAATFAGSQAASAGVAGGPGATGGSVSAQGQRAAAGAGEAGTAGAPARLSGDAALWRMLRRLPMNAVLLLKFIDEKDGAVVQMTQKPQVGNQWVDMETLQAQAEARGVVLASPPRADQPAYGPSPASSWDDEDSTLGGSSPAPNASPWHWELLQEAKRNAAFAASQQQHAQAAAAAAAAAAQAAHWAELAASSKAQRAQQQQGGSGEPDEFEQEMLQQMAGSMLAAPQQGVSSQQQQQDPWSQLATMEADTAAEGLYTATPWPLPGSAAAAAAGSRLASAASAAPAAGDGPPPLPFEPPPAAGGEAPPLPLEEDFDDGPPPLPAYSPPPDEYAPAEFGGLPPLPKEPPPEEDAGLDLLGTSPDFAPPLPSHPAPDAAASEPPLLPPGITIARRPQAAAPLPATSSRAAMQPTPDASVAVLDMPGGSLPPPATQHRTLRTWVGFVTELLPGGRGAVDGHGPDASFFLPSAYQGGAMLQVGTRVRCEGEEWSGGQYRWRIRSLRLDTGGLENEDFGEDGFGEEALPEQPAAEFSQLPPGFQRTPTGQQRQQQQQLHGHAPSMMGQPGLQHPPQGAALWHASGSLGDMAAAAGLLEGPPPGFAAPRGPAAHQQGVPPLWQAGGIQPGMGAPGPAAQQHPYMPHMPEQGMHQQQQLQQQQGPGLWNVQQQQQYMGWGQHP